MQCMSFCAYVCLYRAWIHPVAHTFIFVLSHLHTNTRTNSAHGLINEQTSSPWSRYPTFELHSLTTDGKILTLLKRDWCTEALREKQKGSYNARALFWSRDLVKNWSAMPPSFGQYLLSPCYQRYPLACCRCVCPSGRSTRRIEYYNRYWSDDKTAMGPKSALSADARICCAYLFASDALQLYVGVIA